MLSVLGRARGGSAGRATKGRAMIRRIAIVLCLTTSPAFSQEFVPLDQQLWAQLSLSLTKLSMPLEAHQQVQQMLAEYEKRAQENAAKAKAAKAEGKAP